MAIPECIGPNAPALCPYQTQCIFPRTGGPAPICHINADGSTTCAVPLPPPPCPVPATNELALALMVVLVFVIAAIAVRRKP